MLKRFDSIVVRINQAIIGGMMMVMFALVFVNVVSRYCFGFSFMTAEEISTFLMIWITYLGAGLALREGRHAAIDLFQDLMPEKTRKAFRGLLGLLMLVFFAVLAFYGMKLVAFSWAQETAATQIPRGIPYSVVPIGSAVFGLHLVLMFRKWIAKEWEESPTKDESEFEPKQRAHSP